MKSFVCIHGHFYQPPRENPWLGIIEEQPSAAPDHDWNVRITRECYAANARARMVDGAGNIINLVNNYAWINFNIGPTLLSWLEEHSPDIYEQILQADRESVARWGHGNAIAQAYHHIILPLANARDKETQVVWAKADFYHRFGRDPEGIWLPETACDYPTLECVAKQGFRYVILAPSQAARIRPLDTDAWTDVSNGSIDPSRAYRCFLPHADDRRGAHTQSIDLFFYDGDLAHAMSFGDLLQNGDRFADRLRASVPENGPDVQLIHLATDGENYGHHKQFGDMALAYALHDGIAGRGMELINYGAFLEQYPPEFEVEIHQGPDGLGTSWSCAHGVGRWARDCGCSTGGGPGWHQRWREPLRTALNTLRDTLVNLTDTRGAAYFPQVWTARNRYIDVLLSPGAQAQDAFLAAQGHASLTDRERAEALTLMELQRHAMMMYTSCGWFFNDIAGIETVQILQYAARAIQLARRLGAEDPEPSFIAALQQAAGNQTTYPTGRDVYEKLVCPRRVNWPRVVNQFAIRSLYAPVLENEQTLHAYNIVIRDYEKQTRIGCTLAIGTLEVSHQAIPETHSYLFVLHHLGGPYFRTYVVEAEKVEDCSRLKSRVFDIFSATPDILTQALPQELGSQSFTLEDVFREGRFDLVEQILQRETASFDRASAEFYDRAKPTVELALEEGLKLPVHFRQVAERTLFNRLQDAVRKLGRNNADTATLGAIRHILAEAQQFQITFPESDCSRLLTRLLRTQLHLLDQEPSPEKIREFHTILELLDGHKLPFDRWRIQSDAFSVLHGLAQHRQSFPPETHTFLRHIASVLDLGLFAE